MFLDIPDIIFDDWWSVQTAINQIRFRLGTDATPTYAGLTISGLTASTLIGANASKELESVTIGTGLDYTRPTLSLSHLGIESLTDPNADKIVFWDDSETACKWLGVGNSIAITTTTLDTIQDIRTTASPTFAGLTSTGTIDASAGEVLVEDNDTEEPTDKSDGYVGVAKPGGQPRLYFTVDGVMYYVEGTAGVVPVTGNPIGLLLCLTYNLD